MAHFHVVLVGPRACWHTAADNRSWHSPFLRCTLLLDRARVAVLPMSARALLPGDARQKRLYRGGCWELSASCAIVIAKPLPPEACSPIQEQEQLARLLATALSAKRLREILEE